MTMECHRFRSAPASSDLRKSVHSLFSCADFLYKNTIPRLLDAQAIDRVATPSTQVVLHEGEAIGLWSVANSLFYNWDGPLHSGFYLLHFRLSSSVPKGWWPLVYQEILEQLGSKNDVVRVTMQFPEFDQLGRDAAGRIGLNFEGVVKQAFRHGGRSWARAIYGQSFAASL